MHYKFYLSLFLILSHFIFVGQDLDRINKANYEIDSLIKYNLFDQVERKVDMSLIHIFYNAFLKLADEKKEVDSKDLMKLYEENIEKKTTCLLYTSRCV